MKSGPILCSVVLLAGASYAEPEAVSDDSGRSPRPLIELDGNAAPGADPSPEPASAPAPPGGTRAAGPLGGEIEQLLGAVDRDLRRTQERFEKLGKEAGLARARSVVRGRAYVRLARAGLLPVGGGLGALVEHATKLERLRLGLQRDLGLQQRAVSERARLAKRLAELQARRTPLQAEWKAVSRAQTEMLAADDRRRAFERAFSSSGGADHTAIYGAAGPTDPTALAGGFAAMKGRLPFPIAGRTEVKSARRSGARGLELRAPLGTPVRAVYPGRVAFADDYADYGRTVILDHGDQIYTVTGNLGSIDIGVGEEVSVGTRVGTVGDKGQGALVYFEIRVGASTVSPEAWFGL